MVLGWSHLHSLSPQWLPYISRTIKPISLFSSLWTKASLWSPSYFWFVCSVHLPPPKHIKLLTKSVKRAFFIKRAFFTMTQWLDEFVSLAMSVPLKVKSFFQQLTCFSFSIHRVFRSRLTIRSVVAIIQGSYVQDERRTRF